MGNPLPSQDDPATPLPGSDNAAPPALGKFADDDPLMLLAALVLAQEKAAGAFSWQPLPRQKLALETDAFETLYGGAAGGGKSDLLLAVARLNQTDSILLRKTYPQLEDSLIKRSREIYGKGEWYNSSKHVWEVPGGQRVRFGHIATDLALDDYFSAQFDFVGFDELTQFTLKEYLYLRARARTAKKGQRVRIIGATNPMGVGVGWVMQRWAPWLQKNHPHPAQPGELRWFVTLGDRDTEVEGPKPFTHKGRKYTPQSRTFIPAKLSDNPYLNEEYRANLESLPDELRIPLLEGIWNASTLDDAYQVIPSAWVEAAVERGRRIQVDPTALQIVGVDVARGGSDKTVFVPRRGYAVEDPVTYYGVQTPDGQSVIQLLLEHFGTTAFYNVDAIGVGSSVFDIGRMANLNISGIDWRNKTSELDKSGKLKFINKRARDWWRMRELLDPSNHENPVSLPDDPELRADLTSYHWELKSNGVKLEDKEDVRPVLNRSPDKGDATVLSFSSMPALEADEWIAALKLLNAAREGVGPDGQKLPAAGSWAPARKLGGA